MLDKKWSILYLIGLAVLLISCAGQKEIPRAKKSDLEEVLADMKSTEINYTYFSGKAKVKFEGEEMRVGGKANIRMIKDSLIWMNFKKISIEGSRALIRQDSFWIVYRIDKLYESGTFEELMDAYDMNISFSELQDLMIGNFTIPDKGRVKDFYTKKLHFLKFSDDQGQYDYQLDGNHQMRSFVLEDLFGRKISGVLSDYDSRGFSQKKELSVALEDGSSGKVSIDFSDVEFDIPKTTKFDVPSHYTKLP